MSRTWQQVFDGLEKSGANFADLNSGRRFSLDALRRIGRPLPKVIADAQRIAEDLQNGFAQAEDVYQIRKHCWEYERNNLAPGVAPHQDPVIAALRLAIGATQESVEPEPWYWLETMAMLAEAAGVSSKAIGELLEKHYVASKEETR